MQKDVGREEDSPVTSELDRRLWPRIAREDTEVTLWTSINESQQATVVDESLTGIALLVDDASGLHPDSEVRLIYRGEPMWALVRHVTPADDAKKKVGLEWGCAESRIAPLSFPMSDPEYFL